MGYRMVVLDMDGTLLTDDKKISERNKEAILQASLRGVKVIISTGRIYTSAKVYSEMIGIDTPIIASNGAYIREKDRDEVIYARLLGEENAMEVIRLTRKHNIYCNLLTWDTIYAEKLSFTALNYTKWNAELPEDKRVNVHVIGNSEWEAVINENKNEILKAVIVHEVPDELADLRLEVAKLNVEIASSFSNNFEVMNKGVSKGDAVRKLAEYYGLSRDEIICIGDNENDISMIQFAGMGIAMENSLESTKNAARFVTKSNNDDGVAYAIEKFILNA